VSSCLYQHRSPGLSAPGLLAKSGWFGQDFSCHTVVKPRNVGRPLAVSGAQAQQVLKMHKAGASLRGVAEETNLGLRTVRTIIEQGNRTERTTRKYL
jgi:Helix-turn-helix domain of resolvase